MKGLNGRANIDHNRKVGRGLADPRDVELKTVTTATLTLARSTGEGWKVSSSVISTGGESS